MATAVGPAAIRAKLEVGLASLERLPTTIYELLEAGDTMMVERTEVWHHKTGERCSPSNPPRGSRGFHGRRLRPRFSVGGSGTFVPLVPTFPNGTSRTNVPARELRVVN